MIVQKCKALYDFESRNQKELSFKAGDEITIQTQLNSGWWIGELNGNVGLFPVNYTELGPEENVSAYPVIKLKVSPSALIAKLQKECGLIAEKKELTQLERQKISDKILNLQSKMEATISKNLMLQTAGGRPEITINKQPENEASDDTTEDAEQSKAGTLQHLTKERPLGPTGRRRSTITRRPAALNNIVNNETPEAKSIGQETIKPPAEVITQNQPIVSPTLTQKVEPATSSP